MINRIRMK